MGAVRSLAAALALVAASPAQADGVDRWRGFIAEASARFGIPAQWIERVMRAESAGSTMLNGRPITSSAGAMGLMQLMPATWVEMRRALGLGSNPHNPRDNIMAGTYYLRLMYDRFGYPGMFAAYNAGPARYADHLATGRQLPGETRSYLATVARGVPVRRAVPIETQANTIFFALRTPSAAAAVSPAATKVPGVFVPLQGGPPSE
jgi:soluble lytic murein transglycosylase-like protein